MTSENPQLDLERIRVILKELDSIVPTDRAAMFWHVTWDPDCTFLQANRLGYLRCGVEMLKASLLPEPHEKVQDVGVGAPNLDYLMTDDSNIKSVYLWRVEGKLEVKKPEKTSKWTCLLIIAIIVVVITVWYLIGRWF